MKSFLFVLFVTITGWLHAQLVSDTILTRYCRNDVVIPKKFFILDTDNPDLEVRYILTNKRKKQHCFQLKPLTSEKHMLLVLRSGRKSVKTSIPLTIEDPKLRVSAHYPIIADRFDLSQGLENLTFKLHMSYPCAPYNYRSNCFDVVEAGKLISDRQEMMRYLADQRPDSVFITNIGFKNEQMEFRSMDTLVVKLTYPTEKDPDKWCKAGQIDTLLISGPSFRETDPITVDIDSNPCLYLRFDDGGTENDITIESLSDGKRIFIREFCCGEPIPLLNTTYLTGNYRVTMRGDGSHHGTLYLQVK